MIRLADSEVNVETVTSNPGRFGAYLENPGSNTGVRDTSREGRLSQVVLPLFRFQGSAPDIVIEPDTHAITLPLFSKRILTRSSRLFCGLHNVLDGEH